MLLAAVGSAAYNLVLVLHIVAVVIGFGGAALAAVGGRRALEQRGPVGAGIARTVGQQTKIAEYSVYSVPLWGILLVLLSGDAYTFGQPWVSASFTLYIIGVGLSIGFLRPASKRFEMVVADPAKAAEAESVGQQVAIAGGITNLLWVVVVALMVFKPGL